MSIHDIKGYHPTAKAVTVVKREEREAKDNGNYMHRHEQSLLQILIERNPERARVIVERIRNSGR